MAARHETFCDGNHTDRQACNRALEAMETGSGALASRPIAEDASANRTTVIEAPPIVEHTATFDPTSQVQDEIDIQSDNEPSAVVRQAERGEMPAPSPWAARAWEDTAAAVGATASPAPPPGRSTDESDADDERVQGLSGRTPLLVGLAAAAALAIFIVHRRRA